MPSPAPSTTAEPFRSIPGAAATATDADELRALKRYPRRLMLACGAVLSLLSISVLITLLVVQVNRFEARRIADFRRAHNALQIQLARQDASYARVANMAGYAWGRNISLGDTPPQAMRRAYLEGGQRLMVVADDRSRPQMALGLATADWPAAELQRYLQLSAAVSLIQRLTASTTDGEPASASYFFDPSGQYLSLDRGLTERSLMDALAVDSRQQVFEHLRAPAQLLAPASSHDQVPLLESVTQRGRPRRSFARHPISDEPSLVSVFQALDGASPIATFVAYEPIERLQALLRRNSQGHITLVDRDGLRVLASSEPGAGLQSPLSEGDWVLLGDATRARFHNGRYTLALGVAGTPWTLVETYCWRDILQGIAPVLVAGGLLLMAALALLWALLIGLHRRMYTPALEQVQDIYARDERLQQLLEHLPVGVALLDARSGAVQDQNGTLRRMDLGTGARLLPRLCEAALRSDLTAGGAIDSELPSVHDARQLRHHRARLRSGGRIWPGSVLLVVEDVTDQVHTLREQEERTRQAERCSQAKSHFVAAMSHEIRTPLHGIIGHLELLARAALHPELLERVIRLRQSADSLMDIITDVLDLSRIESGQWTLSPERFAPASMLERVAVLYAPMAQAKGLQLDCVVDPEVPEVAVAPMAAIERVLRNLASNALKFTASGRVQLRVACIREDGQARLRLEVTDSGIGLTAAERERLFQPFMQADASILSRFGGSGLGLALCQQLCERMQGRIWVESTTGVGSRFVFEVPLLTSITTPPALPLFGREIGLLAAAGPWRGELERRLRGWGGQVRLLCPGAEGGLGDLRAGTPVVVFEPSAAGLKAVQDAGHPLVWVGREGPLRPHRSPRGVEVSCYASEALRQALMAGLGLGESDASVVGAIG